MNFFTLFFSLSKIKVKQGNSNNNNNNDEDAHFEAELSSLISKAKSQ